MYCTVSECCQDYWKGLSVSKISLCSQYIQYRQYLHKANTVSKDIQQVYFNTTLGKYTKLVHSVNTFSKLSQFVKLVGDQLVE